MIWACALCGKGYAHDSLGDLFGPYYIHAPRRHPEFLYKKEGKKVCYRHKGVIFFGLLFGS